MEVNPNVDSYIKNRLDQYQKWYDGKAVTMKKNYLNGKIWSAISAVLVPIVTNIPFPAIEITKTLSIDISKSLATGFSTLVALIIALEGILHYREQWKNYRTTEQFLTAQKNLFCNKVGDYSNLTDDEAFKLLVKRVETAITDENAVTLNVLTKIDGAKSADN